MWSFNPRNTDYMYYCKTIIIIMKTACVRVEQGTHTVATNMAVVSFRAIYLDPAEGWFCLRPWWW